MVSEIWHTQAQATVILGAKGHPSNRLLKAQTPS
jgi:hypothetical protein